jgi:hypothetical protein
MIKDEAVCLENGRKNIAKLILGKQFIIRRLSINDMRLLTKERLMTNDYYRIELTSNNNEKIKPTVGVVNSFIKEIKEEKDGTFPIYEVSLRFIQMNENENNFIKKLIHELIDRARNPKKNS